MGDVFSDPYQELDKKSDEEELSWAAVFAAFYDKDERQITTYRGVYKTFTDGSIAIYYDDEPIVLYDAGEDRFYRNSDVQEMVDSWAYLGAKEKNIDTTKLSMAQMQECISKHELCAAFREVADE